jgi:hypothetical protein
MGDVAIYGEDDARPPAPEMTGLRVGSESLRRARSVHFPDSRKMLAQNIYQGRMGEYEGDRPGELGVFP